MCRCGIELVSEDQMSRGSKALLAKRIRDIANNVRQLTNK